MWLAEASVCDIDYGLSVGVSFVKAIDAPYLKQGPPRSGWIVSQPHHSGRCLRPKSPLSPVRARWRKIALLVHVQVQVQAESLQVWRGERRGESGSFWAACFC